MDIIPPALSPPLKNKRPAWPQQVVVEQSGTTLGTRSGQTAA